MIRETGLEHEIFKYFEAYVSWGVCRKDDGIAHCPCSDRMHMTGKGELVVRIKQAALLWELRQKQHGTCRNCSFPS